MVVAITIYILRNKEIHLVTGMNMLVILLLAQMLMVDGIVMEEGRFGYSGSIKILPRRHTYSKWTGE